MTNRKEFSSIRLRPNFTFTGIEKLKVFIEPQYNKIFGQPAYVGSSATANTATETSGNASYTGSLDSVYLRSGYLDLSLSETLNLLVGRQDLSYGDFYILGPSDWGAFGRSFDAIRLRYSDPGFWVDVFQAKVVETQPSSTGFGDDKDFTGVYASILPSEQVKSIDLYALYLSDQQNRVAASTDNTRPWYFGAYGSRLVTAFGDLAWKAEYAKNFGNENSSALTQNSNNDMLDTQVSYQFNPVHRLGLNFFRAGQNWREIYPTTFVPVGRADILGRRNITGGALRWNAQWDERWTTDVDFLAFQRTNKDQTAFQNSGAALGSAAVASQDVGTELDLVAKYMMSKGLALTTAVNVFQVGNYLKAIRPTATPTPFYSYFMIEAKY
ncbi:MAG: alginate export family protein [Bdellovibrionaceae bacterium]|nr:alginate export family protein [Pseudobdellovibrionaceae bacterium]